MPLEITRITMMKNLTSTSVEITNMESPVGREILEPDTAQWPTAMNIPWYRADRGNCYVRIAFHDDNRYVLLTQKDDNILLSVGPNQFMRVGPIYDVKGPRDLLIREDGSHRSVLLYHEGMSISETQTTAFHLPMLPLLAEAPAAISTPAPVFTD